MPSSQKSVLTKLVESIQNEDNFLNILPYNNQYFLKNSRVIGRENEIQILMQIFQHVADTHRSSVVLIHGDAGSGKTALVQKFIEKLPETVLFANGKFESLKNHSPYTALVAASDVLCRQIMHMREWEEIRNHIRDTLGSEVNILESLFPTLSKMMLDDDNVEYVRQEHENAGSMFTRFKQLFRSFLRSVASVKHPIIFFLDDLQWADSQSLDVLKAMVMDDSLQNIMMICAHRKDTIAHKILLQHGVSLVESSDSEIDKKGWILPPPILLENLCQEGINLLVSSLLSMETINTI
jgi:predicted ATPase